MRHTILMFNPTSIDEVYIQATHLEARGKNGNPEVGGPSQPATSKSKEKKSRSGKQGRLTLHRKAKLHALTVKKRGMMMSIVGFCIQSSDLRSPKARRRRLLQLFKKIWG